jgi:hypothetical protein
MTLSGHRFQLQHSTLMKSLCVTCGRNWNFEYYLEETCWRQQIGFELIKLHLGFVVDKMALEQAFLRVLGYLSGQYYFHGGSTLSFILIAGQTLSTLQRKWYKGKGVPVRAIMAYGGNRGIAPFIHKLGSKWRCEVNFTLRPLCRQEKKPVPIEKEAGWAP